MLGLGGELCSLTWQDLWKFWTAAVPAGPRLVPEEAPWKDSGERGLR